MVKNKLGVNRTILLLLTFSFLSCGEKEDVSLRNFFFPFAEFTTPKIYVYSVESESNVLLEYYKLYSNDDLMSVEIFNQDFQPIALTIDKETDSGIILHDLQLVYDDAPVKAEIINPLIYPYSKENNVACSTIFNGQIIENRLAFHKFDQVNINEKLYDCAIFKSITILDNDSNNYSKSTLYYARDIGIIKEVILRGNAKTVKKLEKILTEDEFNKLYHPLKSSISEPSE